MEGILGVDIGGTNIKFWLQEEGLIIRECKEVKNLTKQKLLEEIQLFCKKTKRKIESIGISISGIIEKNVVEECYHRPDLVGLSEKNIKEFGFKQVEFVNDGNAMASYAAKTYQSDNVVAIAAGTRNCLWNYK